MWDSLDFLVWLTGSSWLALPSLHSYPMSTRCSNPMAPKGPSPPFVCFCSGCSSCLPSSSLSWSIRAHPKLCQPQPPPWALLSLWLRFMFPPRSSHSNCFSTYSFAVIIFNNVFFPTPECAPRLLCSMLCLTRHSFIHCLMWSSQPHCEVDSLSSST